MTVKLYLDNSYINEFETNIIEEVLYDNEFKYRLEKTAFYPEGGGQPSDVGFIEDSYIYKVALENDLIYHYTKEKIKESKVTCKVDMENRLDLMSSHTGQHILSGAFEKLYNANTVGFHLTKDNLTIDLDKKLSDIEIINSFRLANKIILENRDVIIHYPNEKELSEIPLRKQPKFSKDIRVIEIKDFDFSPCGGTHVKSTGEIGQISLKRHDIHRGGIRVEFSCSYRSLEDSFKKTNIISALIKLTSSQEEGLKSYVETMINENNSLKKELLLNKEMLLKEQFDKKYSNLQIVNNVNIFSTYDITDSKLHKTYNQIALSNNNSISAIYDKTTNKFTINRSDDLNLDIKEFINGLLSTFQIKGGGNNKQFSGSINISTLDKFHEELLNLIPK